MTIRNPTRKETIDTRLIRVITLLYSMQDDDIAQLQEQISKQLTITYRTVIQAQLRLYGCQKTVTGPDAKAQRFIETKAKQDAEGIARTYNTQLKNEVQRIYNRNPRGNRYFFMRALDAWAAKRNQFKTPSIALNTMTAAREYAQRRFVEENGIEGKWRLVGPPPVCKDCMRIAALGVVTWAVTQKPRNRLPSHVGCPHQWAQLIPKRIECDTAWAG